MTTEDLIRILSNKLASLNNQVSTSTILGNIDEIEKLQIAIRETENMLEALRTITQ